MTQTKTEFWSWKKIEAGHYVLTTDTRYTATVRKDKYGSGWIAEAASPSGRDRKGNQWQDHETMADAKQWALWQIDHLVQQDETALISNALRDGISSALRMKGSISLWGGISRLTSGMTMTGPGETEASFTVEGEHHTYKVTVERWNG